MTTTPTTSRQARADTTITERVRGRYAQAANRVLQAGEGGCCSTSTLATGCCSSSGSDCSAVTTDLYTADVVAGLPEKAVLASLGCGNPTALIDPREGETVLDLGSGGGIDGLLSARRVGPSGFAYGVDMTDEMLALAQENKAQAGMSNVAFLNGRHACLFLGQRRTCLVSDGRGSEPLLNSPAGDRQPGRRPPTGSAC